MNRRQQVASCFVHLNLSRFIINIPECYQRFATISSSKFTNDLTFLTTRGEVESILGLQSTMFTLVDRHSIENTKIVLQKPLLDYINQSSPFFGTKLNFFAFLGIDRQKDSFVLQPGLNSSVIADIPKKHFNHSFAEFAKTLPSSVLERMNSFSNVYSHSSDFFDSEVLKSLDIGVISKEDCEVLVIKHHSKDNKRFRLAYVIINRQKKEKFDNSKIRELRIRPFQIKELIEGKTITKDGLEIRKSDILLKFPKTSAVVFADFSEDFANSFLENPIFSELKNRSNIEFKAMVHLGPASAFKNSETSEKLKTFDVKHIFAHSDFDSDVVSQSKFSQYNIFNGKLSKGFPFFFPRQKSDYQPETLPLEGMALPTFYNLSIDNRGVICHHPDESDSDPAKTKSLFNKIEKDAKSDENSAFHQKTNKLFAFLRNPQLKFSHFCLCLGTGSRTPSLTRNVSSYLIGANPDCFVMLDCGEGTVFQIQEQFGQFSDDVIWKTRILAISHFHFDHFLGVFGFITERLRISKRRGISQPLFLLVPENCLAFLNTFIENFPHDSLIIIGTQWLSHSLNKCKESFSNTKTIPIDIRKNSISNSERSTCFAKEKAEFDKFCQRQKISRILPVPVDHCPGSMGFVLDFSGKRVVYSGDCRPSNLLASEGENADLLIHESTFDCDHDHIDVIKKRHSNIEEAIQIGRKMKASRVMLTHFSNTVSAWAGKNGARFAIPESKELEDFRKKRCFMASDHLCFEIDQPVEDLANSVAINGGFSFQKK